MKKFRKDGTLTKAWRNDLEYVTGPNKLLQELIIKQLESTHAHTIELKTALLKEAAFRRKCMKELEVDDAKRIL